MAGSWPEGNPQENSGWWNIYVKIEQKYLADIRGEMNTHNSHDKN